ncbi:hypothetical protein HQ447_02445 [bacterium]|nr:hypothetical protein [bacterium]
MASIIAPAVTSISSDGTPCLVCFPDPSGNLGDRGIKIRQQLSARGLALKPAGESIGTRVLVHGRKGRKEDYLPIAERLCASGFRCVIPTLIAHGTTDSVSAIAYGKCLYDSLPATTPKRWIEIPAADHDNVLITAYPIYADLAEWMLRNLAGS